MEKNNQPQNKEEQKTQTKYDRKVEERKRQEEKDRREAKIMRIGAIVIGIGIVAAIAGSITFSVLNKRAAVKDAYVTVGSHTVTRAEYDYYFNTSKNSFLTTYSSILSYMGLDMSKDLDEQQYSDTLTWKDNFDMMAVEQIQRTKALADEAAADNFAYDAAEEYDGILEQIETGAESAAASLNEYYKNTYGKYATQNNIEPYIKEGLLASAYYDELIAQNAPSAGEIDEYYGQHPQDYDKVDYRSFAFAAEAGEEATDSAMLEAKKKADAMLEARQGGADFRELCLENASEEDKTAYEDTETDASLKEGAYYSGVPAAAAQWLYEAGRTEGDITVVEDTTGSQYYVVEFISRYYDEADDANISSTISGERVEEYITGLMENYTVSDNKGELKYLTVDTTSSEAVPENAAETAESAIPAE